MSSRPLTRTLAPAIYNLGLRSMINLDDALEVMEGDLDILKSVIEAFLEETPQLLKQLHESIQSGDWPEAQRAAHTLKGGLRILRLIEQQELWANVEQIAKEQRLDEIGDAVAKAEKGTESTLAQLTEFLKASQ